MLAQKAAESFSSRNSGPSLNYSPSAELNRMPLTKCLFTFPSLGLLSRYFFLLSCRPELFGQRHILLKFLFSVSALSHSPNLEKIDGANGENIASWTHITESNERRIQLWCICWQLAAPNTCIKNLTSQFHALIRTHNFDFDIRFWPIGALMSKT